MIRRHTLIVVIIILLCALPVIYFAARVLPVPMKKSQLYTAGQAARTGGQWIEALKQFRMLVELDPDDNDARMQFDTTLREAIKNVPGSDPRTEIELARWLVATGYEAELAEALDRSMIRIPAGEFLRGSNTGRETERPLESIYLDAFGLDRYEVTNAQYRRFVRATGHRAPRYWSGDQYPRGQADVPVVGLAWEDALAYCTWAGKRLPTEAEWEKACRGADGRVYPWGNAWEPQRATVDLSRVETRETTWDEAWALLQIPPAESSARRLEPVGSHLDGASPYGVMDLVGNAAEWVWDWYNWTDYEKLPTRNPRSLGPQWNRCIRGSSWYDPYGAEYAKEASRCAARNSSHASNNDPRAGFRCVR